jgi:hypothetical protein
MSESSMLPLLMLGAHLVGDFVTQTDHMAAHKLTNWRVRAVHVTTYTVGFALVLLLTRVSWTHYGVGVGLIWITHYITDSRRWVTSVNWPPKEIMVDQAIHVMSLGVIGILMGL